MSDTKKTFYLTTPIYYVNARPHIGHAYTTIAADVIARRHRLLGEDTFFLTGTDEHGQKIERSATAAGIPPQQFADQVSAQFESLWKRMGITNDDYIRTTEERHKKGVQKLWQLLQKNGFIELRTYTGQYSIGEEMFVDGPPGTIGPDGKPTETVSEDNYFFKLSEFQRPLIDLIESGELAIQPEVRRNEVLSFLRGNVASARSASPEAGSDTLNESPGAPSMPESHPGMGENVELSTAGTPYLPGALKDLSISRSSFKWGIPVPGDEKHVVYVWLDALANYMTAIGYGSDDPVDQAKFEKYWPADLHLVGKEIIRFHCVYWPAFLMAMKPKETAQEDWNRRMLPKQITAHGWLLFEESKMSKSRGNIVRTETILDAFGTLCPPAPPASLSSSPNTASSSSPNAPSSSSLNAPSSSSLNAPLLPPSSTHSSPSSNAPFLSSRSAAEGSASPEPPQPPTKAEQDLFASDVLRYFLLREIPFGQDGSFSFDALVQRYNSDLANGYGNLVSRTLSMITKYFDGVIPATSEPGDYGFSSVSGAQETMTRNLAAFEKDFENCNFSYALEFVWELLAATDRFITSEAPWKLAANESERPRLAALLGNVAENLRIITILLYPILPYATSKVWAQLGLDLADLTASNQQPATLQWGGLQPGTKLGPLSPIFPRAPKELIQTMTDMEQNNAPKPAPSAGLPQVNNSVDKPAREHTEFRESPISSASATPAMNPIAETTHPIADTAAAPDTPQIAIDDFVKIDLRVARIIVAERIPKADKLLRLEVDLGYEKRQILSGIAQWYAPEELIGRNIVVIANLAPRKMRGLESHGMLLAASHGEDGKPVLATFGEDIALGSRLK